MEASLAGLFSDYGVKYDPLFPRGQAKKWHKVMGYLYRLVRGSENAKCKSELQEFKDLVKLKKKKEKKPREDAPESQDL